MLDLGKLGPMIDGLSTEQKDRIIKHQNWGAAGVGRTWVARGGTGRCLGEVVYARDFHCIGESELGYFSFYYERLCQRHGITPVVRAIKIRAGELGEEIRRYEETVEAPEPAKREVEAPTEAPAPERPEKKEPVPA